MVRVYCQHIVKLLAQVLGLGVQGLACSSYNANQKLL